MTYGRDSGNSFDYPDDETLPRHDTAASRDLTRAQPPSLAIDRLDNPHGAITSDSYGRMRFDDPEEALAPTAPRMAQVNSEQVGARSRVTVAEATALDRSNNLQVATHAVAQTSTIPRTATLPHWAIMLIVGAVAWALIVSRRPDAIFNAQFYAEDGIWFSQAYNVGAIQALLIPNVGYLSMIPRLVAAVSLLFPLLYAPLIFNVCAILIQLSPVVFLFSGRFDELVPNFWAKALLGFLYVALPNSAEVNASITNAQWHISVLTFMIVVAATPNSRVGIAFDGIVLLLSGLSGPFCIALVPILVMRWLMDHRGHTIALFIVNAAAIGAQGLTYVSASSFHRVGSPLGATPINLARLLAGQYFIGATLGVNQYSRLYTHQWLASNKIVVAVTLAGLLMFAFALWKGSATLRLFLAYAGTVYGLCLISPLTAGPVPAWVQLAYPGTGARYEYVPTVAFAAMLVWLLSHHLHLAARSIGAMALIVMLLIGIPSDWQIPPFANLQYGAHVAQFEALPAGRDFSFPINPNWSFTLHKH